MYDSSVTRNSLWVHLCCLIKWHVFVFVCGSVCMSVVLGAAVTDLFVRIVWSSGESGFASRFSKQTSVAGEFAAVTTWTVAPLCASMQVTTTFADHNNCWQTVLLYTDFSVKNILVKCEV